MFIVLSLAGFCILASEDLTKKGRLTWHSWAIVLMLSLAVLGCLFICIDHTKTEAIKDFTKGKYQLEEVVHSDTTYIVKRKR